MRCITLVCICGMIITGRLPARAEEQQPGTVGEATVTIPRSEWEAIKDRLAALEKQLAELKQKIAPSPAGKPGEVPPAPPSVAGTGPPPAEAQPPTAPTAPAGGKYLALPDISLIVQAKGKASSDTRDDARNRIRLSEAELGIQGYVYPNVKADAFITMSPEEGESAHVEEAYLTYLGLRKGLNLYVGEKHVAFGRTNLLHNHSWLYVRPPLALRNLVAEESLAGEGIEASCLLPTKGNLFAQLDLGMWTGQGPDEATQLPDILVGPSAGFSDKFNTARLWASHPLGENNELEWGGSYARGSAEGFAAPGSGHATLTGLDVTYRHFGEANSRLLLRGESIWRREENDLGGSTAKGYYLFANSRRDKYSSMGLLWDWSEFPQAPELHESALSLIWTKQFSEQYYLRLQAIHGARPGDNSYNELLLQWVWGVGPHTHNLE